MFFRNYEHDHIWLYQLYTSATAFEGFPSPLVRQMILHQRKNRQKSNQVPYVQGRLAMAVSVYLLRRSSVQGTYIVWFPLSNHVPYQQYRI